ncbi:formylglycine-generating enzyme [Gammaproteobacteria bacterium]
MIKTDNDHLATGSILSHYRIERVIGRGGFGITYLAEDITDQTKVAIKEYFPVAVATRETDGRVCSKSLAEKDVHQFDWGLTRFRKEVLTLAKFDHENLVPVLYFFEALGTVYMVMPFVEGESLKLYLFKHSVITEQELLKIVLPLLDGLETMHRVGYLHRDIKPDNILIREDGRPMLLDFGSTRQAMGARTPAMTVVLTPGYAPIEQSYQDSSRQGPWTDIFSMGAVMYYVVTGKKPTPATSRILAVSESEPDPLPSLLDIGKGKYRKQFLSAIEHALRVSDKDRPRTVDEWRKELLGEKEIPLREKANDSAIVGAERKIISGRVVKVMLLGLGALLGMGLLVWNGAWLMIQLAEDKRISEEPHQSLSSPSLVASQSFEPEMVSIPAGSFMMGSPTSEWGRDDDEGPVPRVGAGAIIPGEYKVTVGKFFLGKYEVTVGEFRAFVSASGYRTEKECFNWDASSNQWITQMDGDWRNLGFPQTDRHPVACVSWNDAQAYTRWLSKKTGKSYRLPTEAEWEYAARAGTTALWYWGKNEKSACQYANVADETVGPNGYVWIEKGECNDGYFFSAPVGSFRPNGFGLYDMLGNVWEWTCSEYGEKYAGKEQECSSNSDQGGGKRVLRGSSWSNGLWLMRVADREKYSPHLRYGNLGFRVARD